jgi:hypothetical protein
LGEVGPAEEGRGKRGMGNRGEKGGVGKDGNKGLNAGRSVPIGLCEFLEPPTHIYFLVTY